MNFWKSYGAHLLGYVAAAVGIAETLTPAAVAKFPSLAPLQPYVGPTGIVALVATAAGLGIHQAQASGVTVQTAATTAAKAVAPVLAVAFALGLTACASVPAALSSPVGQATLGAVADVTVATAEQHGITAAQINSIAHKALAADQGASASLAAVAGVVNVELASLKLPAGDLAAAQILEAALSVAITERIGSNASLANAQAAAADVINAVIAASGG
jgi:hypothetical protein